MILVYGDILEFLIFLVNRIIRVVLFRKLQPKQVMEPFAAVFTLANPLIALCIVEGYRVPAHVQEKAVGINIANNFADDVQCNFLLIVAVKAHMDQTVVINDFSFGAYICPFRVLFIQRCADLGKVHTADYPDAGFLTGVNDCFQTVPGEVSVPRMEWDIGFVAGRNTAGIDDNGVGIEFLKFTDVLFGIHIRHVDLTQVGLNNSPGTILPPILFAHGL